MLDKDGFFMTMPRVAWRIGEPAHNGLHVIRVKVLALAEHGRASEGLAGAGEFHGHGEFEGEIGMIRQLDVGGHAGKFLGPRAHVG